MYDTAVSAAGSGEKASEGVYPEPWEVEVHISLYGHGRGVSARW